MHLNSGTFLCYCSGGRGLLVKWSFCSRMYVLLTLLSLQHSQQRSPIPDLNDVVWAHRLLRRQPSKLAFTSPVLLFCSFYFRLDRSSSQSNPYFWQYFMACSYYCHCGFLSALHAWILPCSKCITTPGMIS